MTKYDKIIYESYKSANVNANANEDEDEDEDESESEDEDEQNTINKFLSDVKQFNQVIEQQKNLTASIYTNSTPEEKETIKSIQNKYNVIFVPDNSIDFLQKFCENIASSMDLIEKQLLDINKQILVDEKQFLANKKQLLTNEQTINQLTKK